MQALIKRFSQKAPIYTLASIAFLGASLSIELSFLNSTLQFALISFLLTFFTVAVYFGFEESFFTEKTALSIFLTGLLFNPFSGIPALFTVALILLPGVLLLKNYSLYATALISHLLDMLSTYLLIPAHSEANIVVKTLMEKTGVVQGLILSKTLLIVLPLIYSYNYLEKEQQVIFVKFVSVLGLAMAFRNLIIFF